MKQIRNRLIGILGAAASACAIMAPLLAQAQSVGLEVLYSPNQFQYLGTPYGTLLLANDGSLYGEGGNFDSIFVLSTTGIGTVITSPNQFEYLPCVSGCSWQGEMPNPLVQGNDANLYGTTTNNEGSVFKMLPSGQVSTLYFFQAASGAVVGPDGLNPMGSLIQGSDGRFYGTTSAGGTGAEGTIFAITSSGLLTTLHTFSALNSSGYNADGAAPKAGLYLASDGDFYGTTSAGGTYGYGTIFKLTPSGTFTVLRSLNTATDGANPASPLHQASDGYLYGTAVNGGTFGHGTVFKISTTGTFTNLHSFALSDGANPAYGLVEAKIGFTDYLFGSAPIGGAYNDGVIYSLTTTGKFSTLYTFNRNLDGYIYQPQGLTVGPDNNIYGVGAGSVFELITQKPTLTFKASPIYVSPSQPSNLTWSSTSATGCTASGNWSGSEPLSGSQSVVLTVAGTYAYTLTCTGPVGSVKKTVKVTVK